MVAGLAQRGPGVVGTAREGRISKVFAEADELGACAAVVKGDAFGAPVVVEALFQGLAGEKGGGSRPEAGGLGVGAVEEVLGHGEGFGGSHTVATGTLKSILVQAGLKEQ
jgi:hypothetical protein